MLDCAFHELGVPGEHAPLSVLAAEALCAPVASRQIAMELLFEKYGVGSYGHVTEILASFRGAYGTAASSYTGALLSLSHSSATTLHLSDGIPQFQRACRSPIGGDALSKHLLDVMLAKYPEFEHVLTYRDARVRARTSPPPLFIPDNRLDAQLSRAPVCAWSQRKTYCILL